MSDFTDMLRRTVAVADPTSFSDPGVTLRIAADVLDRVVQDLATATGQSVDSVEASQGLRRPRAEERRAVT